ncbi:MAG TPA: SAF domain-containing protein [Acidimicrobiales bacterium]|nr:SAF domain-containing protein [Acidimicrobiales bacterium]
MSTLTERAPTNGKTPTAPVRAKAAPSPVARRRQVPWIVAGVVLVVGCALAFGLASLRATGGEEVLAVAVPVPAGQPISAADLRAVRVSPAAGLQPVAATAEATMLGRPAAVALVPGTLLTAGDVGTASAADAGTAVVAMALKAGAYPPSLGPGAHVEVVPVATTTSGPTTPLTGQLRPVGAVVIGVEAAPSGSSADAVVSLQVDPSDATEVAQLGAAGQAVLVQLPAGSAQGGSGR